LFFLSPIPMFGDASLEEIAERQKVQPLDFAYRSNLKFATMRAIATRGIPASTARTKNSIEIREVPFTAGAVFRWKASGRREWTRSHTHRARQRDRR